LNYEPNNLCLKLAHLHDEYTDVSKYSRKFPLKKLFRFEKHEKFAKMTLVTLHWLVTLHSIFRQARLTCE
jgi:hypothetical protein